MVRLIKFVILSCFLLSCDTSTKENHLIVGVAADNVPYEFIKNGEIVGLDIDLVYAIGDRLNKKIIIQNFDFSALFAALMSRNVDMVISGVTATTERARHVRFSQSYMSTKLSILYRKADGFKNLDDLNSKVIGVLLGSTWKIVAHSLAQNRNITIHALSNNLMLVEELKSRTIDAIILEEFQAKKFIQSNSSLASFNLDNFSSELVIAVSQYSDLLPEINTAIDELKNDGTLDKIIQKWLKSG